MQLNLSEYSDNFLLQLLANDLFKRDKYVRDNLIIDHIIEKIMIEWLDYAHANRLFNNPTKCVVRFVETNNDSAFEGKPFTLTATLDHGLVENIDDYTANVRRALTYMKIELRNNYDLDKVEFDGSDAIKVFEYHDIMKGK